MARDPCGFLETRPEQSLLYALDRCPAGNSSHDNQDEDHGNYQGHHPTISHSTTPC